MVSLVLREAETNFCKNTTNLCQCEACNTPTNPVLTVLQRGLLSSALPAAANVRAGTQ